MGLITNLEHSLIDLNIKKLCSVILLLWIHFLTSLTYVMQYNAQADAVVLAVKHDAALLSYLQSSDQGFPLNKQQQLIQLLNIRGYIAQGIP